MTGSVFSALDVANVAAQFAMFAQDAQIIPRKKAAGGPNALWESDPDRTTLTVQAIRSETAGRVDIANNGLGRNPGMMRLGVAGDHAVISLEAGLAWPPRPGDEVVFADRPLTRYRLAEPLADGGAALHFVANRISG